jgi:hypothetical protein
VRAVREARGGGGSMTLRELPARALRRIRSLSPRAVLVGGYALFVLYAFPGYMSADSALQLHEARALEFTDAHPPFMAAQWAVLDAIVSGPLLMLLVQGALFLLGAAAILRAAMSPRAAAWTACAILLYPPVLTTMGVIWKDSQMAGYLLAGTAALIAERRCVRLVGLGLIATACAFRYNAFAAAIPLVFVLFAWRPNMRWLARYAIALAAALACPVVACGVNRAITTDHKFLTPAMADIVGVLAFTDDRSDAELRELLRDAPLRVTTHIQNAARLHYSPRNAWSIDHGEQRMFDAPTTERERAALVHAWRVLVLGDIAAYLEYRITGFAELIGWSDAPLWSPTWNLFVEARDHAVWIEHDAFYSSLQYQAALHYIGFFIEKTPLFHPYIYAIVALALLVLCCRDRLTFALLSSGIGYELSFFPAAGTPDFRYSHWLIVSTTIAAALLFARRWKQR